MYHTSLAVGSTRRCRCSERITLPTYRYLPTGTYLPKLCKTGIGEGQGQEQGQEIEEERLVEHLSENQRRDETRLRMMIRTVRTVSIEDGALRWLVVHRIASHGRAWHGRAWHD